jgi:putative MATE family efflux protein
VPAAPRGKFVTGSTLRHVVTMTATGSIGLGSLFLVDVLNLFYISLLGQQELAAAVGYAGTLLFFITSLSIGLSIAATALTSRALGAGERHRAQQLSGASLLIMGGALLLAAVLVFPWLPELLGLLGATGDTAELALRFCRIVLPSAPLLGLVMCLGALLRALGDGRRAMFVTLGGGLLTAVLDPLLIFGLGWGLDGAAVSTVLARAGMVVLGFYLLVSRHRLLAWPTRTTLATALPAYAAVAFPAVLTQVATPVGNAFVTAAIAPFGDSAVAGWAVVVRVIPVAFVALFALSGSVGPILGQNLGAGRLDRLRSTLRDSLKVVLVYVLVVWLLLALGRGLIADAFGAQGEARQIIEFFCLFVAGSFFFNGALFVGNAAFNNLGFAFYSTALNWGRSTLGVVPFIWLGGQWFGAVGVLAGYGLGVVLFGLLAIALSFRVVDRLGQSPASGHHMA